MPVARDTLDLYVYAEDIGARCPLCGACCEHLGPSNEDTGKDEAFLEKCMSDPSCGVFLFCEDVED